MGRAIDDPGRYAAYVKEDQAALDRLPKRLRQALANSHHSLSASYVLDCLEAGTLEEDVLKYIETGDPTFIF